MQKRLSLALLGAVTVLTLATSKANAIVLDDFTVALGPVNAQSTPAGPKSTTMGGAAPSANVLGGYQTLTVDRTSPAPNAGSVGADINLSDVNTFSFNSGPNTAGRATLLFDNNGAGLGGVDISAGATGLLGQYGSDLGASFILNITDTANVTSMATLAVPGTGSASNFFGFNIPFGALVGGANLTSVKSISLVLDGTLQPSTDVSLRLLQFSTPPPNVPEPGSIALLIGGAMSGAVVLRRRRK